MQVTGLSVPNYFITSTGCKVQWNSISGDVDKSQEFEITIMFRFVRFSTFGLKGLSRFISDNFSCNKTLV